MVCISGQRRLLYENIIQGYLFCFRPKYALDALLFYWMCFGTPMLLHDSSPAAERRQMDSSLKLLFVVEVMAFVLFYSVLVKQINFI